MIMDTAKLDCTKYPTYDSLLDAVDHCRGTVILTALRLNHLKDDRHAFKEVIHPDAQLLYFNDKLLCTFYTPSSFGTELRIPYEIHKTDIQEQNNGTDS